MQVVHLKDQKVILQLNLGNAKAKDILDLMYIVKSTVKSKYGITLEEEVKILGED